MDKHNIMIKQKNENALKTSTTNKQQKKNNTQSNNTYLKQIKINNKHKKTEIMYFRLKREHHTKNNKRNGNETRIKQQIKTCKQRQ